MAKAGWSGALLLALAFLPAAVRAQQEPGAPAPADAWQDYPVREVERPILPPARGFMASLMARSLSTGQALDQDGREVNIRGPYNFLIMDLNVAYGITDHVEFSVGLPYLSGEIGQTKGGSVGDIHAACLVSLVPRGKPADVAVGLAVSYPLGAADYEYEIMGHNLGLQNFRAHDPGFDLNPELMARYRVGRASLRLGVTGIITQKAEADFNPVNGEKQMVTADPGDGYAAESGIYFQATDHWVPGLFLDYTSVSQTMIDGQGLKDGTERFEIQPRLMFQQSQAFEAMLGAGIVLFGKNTPLAYPIILQISSRF